MLDRVLAFAHSPRVRALASYPFRLGPPAAPGERQTVASTRFGGLAVVHNLSGVGDALVTVALAGSLFVSVSLHAARARIAMTGMRAMAGFMTALVVFAFRRQGAPVTWYGLVAVASVGANLAGAALAPVFRDRIKEKLILAGAGLVIATSALAVTQWPDLHRRPAALVLAVSRRADRCAPARGRAHRVRPG